MKENKSKTRLRMTAAIIVLIAAIIFVVLSSAENAPYLYGGGGRQAVGGEIAPMIPGEEYALTGTCDNSSIVGVALDFDSSGTGELTAGLDVNGQRAGTLHMDASEISSDTLTRFVFDGKTECSPDSTFILTLVYKGTDEEAPSIRTDDNTITAGYEVVWDAVSGTAAALMTGIAVAAAGIIIILTVVMKFYQPEQRFVILYAVTGICLLAVLPLYRSPDEYAQFARIIEICRGQFVSPGSTLAPEALSLNNAALASTTQRFIFDKADIPLGWQQLDYAFFPNTSYFFPTAFLPHAVMTFIVHLFTDRLIPLLYAARLGNFIGCGLVIWAAIRTIPYGKDIIAAVALFPMSLQGFISASADGFSFALFMLFTALILRARNDRHIFNAAEIVLMYIVTLLFSLSKTAYTPLCLLLFLIPRECFGKKRNYWLNVVLLGTLLVGINLLWVMHASSYPKLVDSVDTAAQINWILGNPREYAYVIFNTVIKNGPALIGQMFGSWLGWLNIGLPWYLMLIIGAAAVYIAVCDNNTKMKIGESVFVLLLCGITLIAAMSAVYLQFNNTANGIVEGFQGRYLIPLIVPAALAVKRTRKGYRDTGLAFAVIGIADAVCAGLVLLQTI